MGSPAAYKKAMHAGHTAAWEQRWADAAGFYRTALDESPDDMLALTSLGLANFEMQDYPAALTCYQRACEVNPEDPLPFEKTARILEKLGRLTEAVQVSLQTAELYLKSHDVEKAVKNIIHALSVQPDNLNARSRLAVIYEKMGKKYESVQEYIAVASLLQRKTDPSRAVQILEHAESIMPESKELHQALSIVRSKQLLPEPKRPQTPEVAPAAKPSQLEAPRGKDATPDPVTEARQKALAELAVRLFDQPEEGETPGQVSRRSITTITRGTGALSLENAENNRIKLHLSEAIESLSKGAEKAALEDFERAGELGLNSPGLHFLIGMLQLAVDPGRALRRLQISVQHPEYALASYLLIGQGLQSTGKQSEASAAYLQALRLADGESVPADQRDDLMQLYEPLIGDALQGGDVHKQEELCKSISNQLNRPNWRSYLRSVRAELPTQGDGSAPLPLAEMILQTSSAHVVEALGRIRKLASQGKFSTATEEAYQALQYAPTYLPLHTQIAELLALSGQANEAVTKFLLVAQLYNLRGEAGQAIRLLQRVIPMAPMDLSIRSHLIELLRAQGRVDEALQQYTDLGEVYYMLAELDLARQTYSSGLALVQESPSSQKWAIKILTRMADIDMQRMDMRNALKIVAQLRTLLPEDSTICVQLIDLNFRMQQDLAALSEADSFVATLEKSGQPARALAFLTEVVEAHPDKVDLRRRLAEALGRNGEIVRAVEQWDMIANELLDANNRRGAIAVVERIIALEPPNVDEYRRVLADLRTKG